MAIFQQPFSHRIAARLVISVLRTFGFRIQYLVLVFFRAFTRKDPFRGKYHGLLVIHISNPYDMTGAREYSHIWQ